MTDHEFEVLDCMEQYGGSFVSHLAMAWRRADATNFMMLMVTFPEYWKEYEKVAEQIKIKKNKERL